MKKGITNLNPNYFVVHHRLSRPDINLTELTGAFLLGKHGIMSLFSIKPSNFYLFRSTVVTLNTTPLSQRIMKRRWENGQFPMLSPSIPA